MGLLQQWVDRNPECVNTQRGDQQAFQDVFHVRWEPRKESRIVPNPDFTDGRTKRIVVTVEGTKNQLFKIPTELVGQCGEKGEYATHYNCYANKLTAMKTNGDWDTRSSKQFGAKLGQKSLEEQQHFIQLGDVEAQVAVMRANG